MTKGINTVGRAVAIGEPIAKELGFRLWDVRFEKEGTSWFLRYYIDKDEPVSIDDCEAFSRKVDVILDTEDFIEESYYLEVSSPGIERELRTNEHYLYCLGKDIEITLFRPLESGERVIVCRLLASDGKEIKVKTENDEKVIPLNSISKAKLIYKEEGLEENE